MDGNNTISTAQRQQRRQGRSAQNSEVTHLIITGMDSVTRKKRRSLSADDNFTPRTLIQGFLQTAQTVRQSPRKRARVTPSSTRTPAADPLSAQRRRSKTPRTLPRPAPSARRRSTRLEILATPGGSNPTPRGLITGFLQAADVQTPAVHIGTRRSSPLKQPTPATHRSVLQARAESTNSSSIESPVDDALSRFARPQPREGRSRRQRAINREEFAARVRDRMGQEERDERREEEEEEATGSSRDTTANRTTLDSIVEEPHDASLPRPDSTTKDNSYVQASGSGRSSQRSRSRRSLLDDSSFQVPSTSTGADVPAQDNSVTERRASHPSASSIEDGSVMDQATQDTIQARLSSNTDTEDERRDGEDEEEIERLERTPGDREAVAAVAEDVDEQEEEEEDDEEEMDLDEDDDFDENNLVAPTQPAQLDSVKKSSRSSMASPLYTPHLRSVGRRPTPKAKTPGPFREAAQTQDKIPLHLRGATKKPPAGRGTGAKEPPSTLPKSLTRSIFSHFSKARVSRDALAVVDELSGKYFKNLSKDLMAYCKHAGRNTIEQADVELLMKRQRLVSDKEPLHSLIEKYLPLEYREELIPMARSGNKVYPKMPKK